MEMCSFREGVSQEGTPSYYQTLSSPPPHGGICFSTIILPIVPEAVGGNLFGETCLNFLMWASWEEEEEASSPGLCATACILVPILHFPH